MIVVGKGFAASYLSGLVQIVYALVFQAHRCALRVVLHVFYPLEFNRQGFAGEGFVNEACDYIAVARFRGAPADESQGFFTSDCDESQEFDGCDTTGIVKDLKAEPCFVFEDDFSTCTVSTDRERITEW